MGKRKNLMARLIGTALVVVPVLSGGAASLALGQSTVISGPSKSRPASASNRGRLPSVGGTGLQHAAPIGDLQIAMDARDIANHDQLFRAAPLQLGPKVTVEEIVSKLSNLGYSVYLNKEMLEEESVFPVVELASFTQAPSLGIQLQRMLQQQGLCLRFSDGVVEITSQENSEDSMIRATFDITAFKTHPFELIDAIQCQVNALGWEENGGPAGATLTPIRLNGRILLTVTNTSHNVFEVRKYLQELSGLVGGSAVGLHGGSLESGTVLMPPKPPAQERGMGGGLFNHQSSQPTVDH